MLQATIVKSYLAANQNPPEGQMMITQLATWAELLEHIPTEYINEYFLRAGRRKKGGFPANAYDIAEEWARLTNQRRWDSLIDDPAKRGGY